MKRHIAIILFIFPLFLFAQQDIKKLVSENNPIPSDWVNILKAKSYWTLTNEGSWLDGKIKSLKKVKDRGSIVYFSDTSIKYYSSNKTFYTGKNFDEYWDMGVSVVNQVIYLDSSLLIIRKIPFFLFEKETGRILSYAEFEKIWEEKQKNRPKKEFIFTNHFTEPKTFGLQVYRAI